jgi:hypothetical protein
MSSTIDAVKAVTLAAEDSLGRSPSRVLAGVVLLHFVTNMLRFNFSPRAQSHYR